MKLIAITSKNNHDREIQYIPLLFKAGLNILHVRKPEFNKNQLSSFISLIPAEYHDRLVIHSHFELHTEIKIKGIHLPEKIRKENYLAISKIVPNKKMISSSFHHTDDLINNEIPFEYVFISPVFDSISKVGYKSNFDFKKLNNTVVEYKKNQKIVKKAGVIALGGINDLTINKILDSSFDGAAVSGYLWEGDNPLERYEKLISKIK